MKSVYKCFKGMLVFGLIINIYWLKIYSPTLVFMINAILFCTAYTVILFYKGVKQIELMIKVFTAILIVEPIVIFFRYNSIYISLFSLFLCMLFLVFLIALKEEMEGDEV